MFGQIQREQDKKVRNVLSKGITFSQASHAQCDTLVQIPIWIAPVLPITKNLKSCRLYVSYAR